ncbi:acetyltransferase, fucose-4-O-acetylase [Desulfosporosinus acidiphilus SJ4]|uniref:Acetyltransferase, fucose-4-O-acetylase n=1 Tax=Desulfosporosinus acidiphilus (strain DSM 22704 / JCM 16185 / SJ4) TaxID=646529 RepID=I4D6E6_DESAJ|nr:acyltransferase family protein [Desulfosporosinus acidiphilus]AFM41370.1 acetyltransferase, fucose-4-O-acetylase [Desulfosporosinus acidiphilus SJ4]
MDKRTEYLDIAKGLLIISVILTHSPWPYAPYMYWFHMPAFFIISGLLYRDGIDFKRQFFKFYLPYFSFSAVDILFNFLMYPGIASLGNFLSSFKNYIYGGKAVWGVFWFIPVLLISKFLFSKLKSNFKTPYVIAILSLGYIAVHIYSIKVIPNSIVDITKQYWLPLDIDVVPLALVYYAIGFYSKNIIRYLVTKTAMFISGIACLLLTFINFAFRIDFYMNMKDSYYKSLIWDLIIPLCFTIFILAISNNLVKGKLRNFLNYCGVNSLIIMYLHRPIGNLTLKLFPSVGWLGYTLCGLFVSIAFNFIISQSFLTQILFKGKLPKYKLRLSFITHQDSLTIQQARSKVITLHRTAKTEVYRKVNQKLTVVSMVPPLSRDFWKNLKIGKKSYYTMGS